MAIFNEKEPYVFREYPKSVDGKVVTSAAEEAALKAESLPSAADLDAVAEEQKAVEATTTDVDATQVGITDSADAAVASE